MRGPLIAIIALSLVYWGVAALSPVAIGQWQDDGIYVCTAKALAEGRGYRHIQIPGEPWQTKYPILYPALLAAAWLFHPQFPQNAALLLAPGAVAAAVFVVMSSLYLRRVFGESWITAGILGGLAALSPAVVSIVRFTMSETVYAALAVSALYCLDARTQRPTAGVRGGWTALSAALAALAMLTRSIGITLAAAAITALLLRRRWRDAIIAAAVIAALLTPWQLWKRSADAANGPLQTTALLAPDLVYGLWTPQNAEQVVRAVVQNTVRVAMTLGMYQLALPLEWFVGAVMKPGPVSGLAHGICYFLLLLLVLGYGVSVWRGWTALHLAALLYAGLVLVWPFDPYRFVVPWTPFVIYFVFAGVRATHDGLARLARLTPPSLSRDVVCGALGLAALTCFAIDDIRMLRSTRKEYYARDLGPIDLTEFDATAAWVREHALEHEVCASAYSAWLYLATGRQSYYFWPVSDPYDVFYGPDRKLSQFFAIPSPREYDRLTSQLGGSLEKMFREARITYYVEHAAANPATIVMMKTRDGQSWLRPAFTTPGKQATVFTLVSRP
ncbi:hypothetical protein RAS1_38420 [Phycisphaerae bacterium RAS1]|nr:hypothetical protein RAS1_38420 [Phycisphaerae bacterium RAS1]